MPILLKPPPTATDAYATGAAMCQATLLMVQDQRRLMLASSDVPVEPLTRLFDGLRECRDVGQSLISVDGLDAQARSVMGADFSIVAWFSAVLQAGTLVTEWLIANLPSDGNGGIVLREFVTGARTREKTIPSGDLTPVVALLDDLITALQA